MPETTLAVSLVQFEKLERSSTAFYSENLARPDLPSSMYRLVTDSSVNTFLLSFQLQPEPQPDFEARNTLSELFDPDELLKIEERIESLLRARKHPSLVGDLLTRIKGALAADRALQHELVGRLLRSSVMHEEVMEVVEQEILRRESLSNPDSLKDTGHVAWLLRESERQHSRVRHETKLERKQARVLHLLVEELRRTLASDGLSAAMPLVPEPSWKWPPFVERGAGSGAYPLDEREFFARFDDYTKARGFSYRPIDLKAFHQNFKTSDLLVLGGISGTGKSWLPELYSDALAGQNWEAPNDDRPSRFLRIAVNPTWLEIHDLMGRLNLLDRVFLPGESGLFIEMIWALEEHRRHNLDSGVYVVVLDEMNLAQVEHYFSPMLQQLGKNEDRNRRIRIFDRRSVRPDHRFEPYGSLELSSSLHFVGTVNYDETTRRLSARVLDRGPEMRMRPADEAPPTLQENARAGGQQVNVGHLRSWLQPHELEDWQMPLLLELAGLLAQAGFPLAARRKTAIKRFLETAHPEILTPREAFDIAIAQRLLPVVRGLFRKDTQEAFTQFRRRVDREEFLQETQTVVSDILRTEGSFIEELG